MNRASSLPLAYPLPEPLVVRVLSLELLELCETVIKDLEDGEILRNIVFPCKLLQLHCLLVVDLQVC